MISIFNRFIKKQKAPAQVTVDSSDPKAIENDVLRVPRYPPFDHGVPLVGVDDIIKTQALLISRIKQCFGANSDFFESMVMRTIRNYAAYVHLLPATSKENHNNAGGLFRLGLEVGFYAMQAAEGKIFSTKEGAEERRKAHPKWVFATFIAGLCSEMYRPIIDMSISCPKGKAWPALIGRLYDWGKSEEVDRYYIHWKNTDSRDDSANSATYVLNLIISPEVLEYINIANGKTVSYMTASVGNAARNGDGNIVAELVKSAKTQVIEKDIKANAAYYGKHTLGSHLEPHIIDIIRELVESGAWTVNTKQSRIWYLKDGCYIIWSAAFKEITSAMTKRKMAGIPSSPDTLAEMLLGSGMLEPPRDGGLYWEITLPGNPKIMEAIKLSDPYIILNKDDFSPLNITVGNDSNQERQQSQKSNPSKGLFETDIHKSDEASEKSGSTASNTGSNENYIDKTGNDKQDNKNNKKPEKNSNINPDVVNKISDEAKNLLTCIEQDFNGEGNDHPVYWMNSGLVISREEFESHALPHVKVFSELAALNWIIKPPGAKGLVFKPEVNGQKIAAYIINRDIALSLGFKEE